MSPTTSAASPSVLEQVFSNPNQGAPVFKFGNGDQGPSGAQYFPTLPPIPGHVSPWQLVEWKKSQYLNPSAVKINDPSTYSSLYGNAQYSWSTQSGESSFQIYHDTSGTPWALGLNESGGTMTSAGGSDIFLQSKTSLPDVNFGNTITLQLQAQITQAEISYASAQAKAKHLVNAHVGVGFSVWFNEPGTTSYNATLPSFQADMNILVSESPNSPTGPYLMATPNKLGGASLIYGATLPGDPSLPFAASGQSSNLSYTLNNYLQDMVTQPWAVSNGAGQISWHFLPSVTQNLSMWTLRSISVGIETDSSVQELGSHFNGPQGTVSAGVIVSNLSVTSATNQPYSPSSFSDPIRVPDTHGQAILPWQEVAPGQTPPLANEAHLTTSSNTVIGGSSLLTVADFTGGNTIIGGSGGVNLAVSKGADVITTASGARDTLRLAGGDTVTALGTDTITTLGSALVRFGSGALSFVGGAGLATILGGTGAYHINGGSGGLDFVAGSGSGTVAGGSGADTIVGGSGNLGILGGSGNLIFTAGSGITTIKQSTGTATVVFGSGRTNVTAGSGYDVFQALYGHGGGTDTIKNFRFGIDTLQYQGFIENPVQSSSWGSSSSIIHLVDGSTISLIYSSQ